MCQIIFLMAPTITDTKLITGSWSFGEVDSGFFGNVVLNADGSVTVSMLEGNMELNALYFTNYQDEGGEFSKVKGSKNLNGLKTPDGKKYYWDGVIDVNDTGLAGDMSGMLTADSESSSITLTDEKLSAYLNKFGAESLDFGIRGTSVGEDFEDSVKVATDGFVKDEPVFTGDEFDRDRLVSVEQVEGFMFKYEFGDSKQMYSTAELTSAEELISEDDNITNIKQLSSGADDFFMLARSGQGETLTSLDETRDAMSGYSSIEFALSAGMILNVKDSDSLIRHRANETGIYSLTREGIFFDGELVEKGRAQVGDSSQLGWSVSGNGGLYGFDMTLASNAASGELGLTLPPISDDQLVAA